MNNEIRPITDPLAVQETVEKVRKATDSIAGSVKIRMKSATEEDAETRRRTNTEFLVTGYEHALKAVLAGVAELA